MPLVALDSLSIAYGHLPLLDNASLQVDAGERVCVVGRNGAGKSTLLRVIAGEEALQSGRVWRQPGVRMGHLVQDAALDDQRSVFDVVAAKLGGLASLVAAYHHAAVELARIGDAASLERLGTLQQELEERDGWRLEQRVETIVARLGLPADVSVNTLSGGWRRRVLLACALVVEPELLLLDEPTNHLDLDAIAWLEDFLNDYPGAVVFVTHDRAFLQKTATRIVELDRGALTSWPGSYASFLQKKEEWLANEAIRHEKFDKRLAEEEVWLRQGIKARRTRDEGRVRALMAMRQERAARRAQAGAVRLQMDVTERSGQLVIAASHLTKTFGGEPVVRNFSTRIMRGDRVGVIGPNGAGKTTLLRLLIGDLPPDAGEVRHGANLQIVYFDQQREQLDPECSVVMTIADGRETVTVGGREQHVYGYLKDFLFPPERAQSPVKSLSGGERNRLLLARLLTRPANVIVLDEPTNDLDIETLELLEARLTEWPGTLLVVSHDRTFIDHIVTSTLVFEGHGHVQEYVGGYTDWLRQRPELEPPGGTKERPPGQAVRETARLARPAKPTYREQQELQALPGRIEMLEAEQETLSTRVSAPEFYREEPGAITLALARLDALEHELLDAYRRWDELESRNRGQGTGDR